MKGLTLRNPDVRYPLRYLCLLYLLFFVFSEAYSATATAFDHSRRFPAWEATVGLFLLILPCELLVCLALLLRGGKARIGFYLVIVNLIVYAGFYCLEIGVDREGVKAGDLVSAGIWAVLIAIAVASAHFLRISSDSSYTPDRAG